jgi:hypothetical protein
MPSRESALRNLAKARAKLNGMPTHTYQRNKYHRVYSAERLENVSGPLFTLELVHIGSPVGERCFAFAFRPKKKGASAG